jgi:hypothetical protein
MKRLIEKREILCTEDNQPFKERLEQLVIDDEGVKRLEAHRYYHCSCGSLIRVLPEMVANCAICGARLCPKCYGGLCGGIVVCKACCPVNSRPMGQTEAAFYCFSCRMRRKVSSRISSLMGRIRERRALTTVGR